MRKRITPAWSSFPRKTAGRRQSLPRLARLLGRSGDLSGKDPRSCAAGWSSRKLARPRSLLATVAGTSTLRCERQECAARRSALPARNRAGASRRWQQRAPRGLAWRMCWHSCCHSALWGGSQATRNPRFAGVSLERMRGLEPPTFCMASRRSSQLSYIRQQPPIIRRPRWTTRDPIAACPLGQGPR